MLILIKRKAGVAIFILHKADFRAKNISLDKEGRFIMIKGSVHQKNIVILNVYAPKKKASKYMKGNKTTKRKTNPQL